MKKTITLKSTKCKSLNGIISVPTDKSISHRALILSSLCLGNTKIFGLLESDDVKNTLINLKKLGIVIKKRNEFYEVYGNGGLFSNPSQNLDFGNSGTGVRLMIGLLSTRNICANLVGDPSLSSRPMMRVIKPLKKMNALFSHNNGFLPIKILDNSNTSIPIEYNLEIGSAQVKSAILLASLNVKGTTRIKEKNPSRNHTEIMLEHLGANVEKKKNVISLNAPSFLKPKDIQIPGDFSSAAFIIVATLLTKNSYVKIKNVGLNFFRTGLIDVLKKMNAKINIKNIKLVNGEMVGDIEAANSELISTKVEKKITTRLIDEFPILFVAASFANGLSQFSGLSELKLKESDRLKTMAKALEDAGVEISIGKDSMKINGKMSQKGGNLVKTNNDHRIAMSMLIFGLVSTNPIVVDDIRMIKTSFPNFKGILEKIGARIDFVSK